MCALELGVAQDWGAAADVCVLFFDLGCAALGDPGCDLFLEGEGDEVAIGEEVEEEVENRATEPVKKPVAEPTSEVPPVLQFKKTRPTAGDVFPPASNPEAATHMRRLHNVGLRV